MGNLIKATPSKCMKCEYGMQICHTWGCCYAIVNKHSRRFSMGYKDDIPDGYCKDFTPRKRRRTVNDEWINTQFRAY